MQRAIAQAPRDPYVYRCLGIELRKARRFAESAASHRRAMEILPGHPNLMLEYSLTLHAAGDTPGAIAVLEEVHRREGGEPIYQTYLTAMRNRLEDPWGTRRLLRWIGRRRQASGG